MFCTIAFLMRTTFEKNYSMKFFVGILSYVVLNL